MKTISEHEYDELFHIKVIAAKLGFAIQRATLTQETPEQIKAASDVAYWMEQMKPNLGILNLSTTQQPTQTEE